MNYPPLPPYLTLDDAAHAVSERLGQQWTARHVLGCASRGDISIFARLPLGVRMVRVEPLDGEKNEIIVEAGSLPRISEKAIRALLLADIADFDELTYRRTVDFFGEPVETMVTVWKLASGETAPSIRPDDCRVHCDGVLQVVNKHTQAAQAESGASVAHPEPLAIQAINAVSRFAAQEAAILEEIRRQGHDPLTLPRSPAGKKGVKADIRTKLLLSRKDIFQSKGVFDDAWQRLRDDKKIGDPTG